MSLNEEKLIPASSPISEEEIECRIKGDKTDPGACRHGNFINYYKFHPVEERIRQLPRSRDVWQHADANNESSSSSSSSNRKYVGIDVGCNAGDLTVGLYDFLIENLPNTEVSLLGVDLDPILIERAKEGIKKMSNNHYDRDVDYKCVDFMSTEIDETIDEYLLNKIGNSNVSKFDVAFCFSITMWIHINHGDVGLENFLKKLSQKTRIIIIEPQPWKCYRNACRRMRRGNIDDIPNIDDLKYKGDMEKHIENILKSPDCGFEKITKTENNEWGRKLLIYRRN